MTFTATPEMAEYYCSVHPVDMRGAVDVVGDMPSEVEQYAGEDGVVETEELLEAIEDWRAGDLDTEILVTLIDHWRSGDPVE